MEQQIVYFFSEKSSNKLVPFSLEQTRAIEVALITLPKFLVGGTTWKTESHPTVLTLTEASKGAADAIKHSLRTKLEDVIEFLSGQTTDSGGGGVLESLHKELENVGVADPNTCHNPMHTSCIAAGF